MDAYGIHHCISLVANPHANSSAELGVRTVKIMMCDNIGQFGKLDMAKFSRSLPILRTTPDCDTRMSSVTSGRDVGEDGRGHGAGNCKKSHHCQGGVVE